MKVTIVQESLRQYRIPFFDSLRRRLSEDGIELALVVGVPTRAELAKGDAGEVPWANAAVTRRFHLGGRSLVWQGALRASADSDLVIVEQASRHLLNYALLAWRLGGGPRVAFWGHGRNLQTGSVSPTGEFVKKALSRRVDWWFAYNDLSARLVADMGYPKQRITSVMNSIDTSAMRQLRRDTSDLDVRDAAASVGITSKNVGAFVGSIYASKRMDLLVGAATRIREKVPDFELIVIGDGPDRVLIESAAARLPYVRVVGRKSGRDLALLIRSAKLLLLPASVGLVVVDSFALEVPIVTLGGMEHGPEVDYISHGENGWVVSTGDGQDAASRYADAVVSLLGDNVLRDRLVEGCYRSSRIYTLDNMVERFAAGVRGALTS